MCRDPRGEVNRLWTYTSVGRGRDTLFVVQWIDQGGRATHDGKLE